MISFLSKFKIGEEVYTLIQKDIYQDVPCDLCNDSQYIPFEDSEILCPKCKGKKIFKSTNYKAWSIIKKPLMIRKINVKIHADAEPSIKYSTNYMKSRTENLFFKTKEEAKIHRDTLNKAKLSDGKDILIAYNSVTTERIFIKNQYNEVHIDTKYNINDTVYYNVLDKTSNRYTTKNGHIHEIRVCISDEDIPHIRYKINTNLRTENNVFLTPEDAALHCENMNLNLLNSTTQP